MMSNATEPLSRERIVACALEVIDVDGLDALSLRTLAERLATKPMSLYRHIRDKADILDGVRSALLNRVPSTTPSADWRADLARWATAFHAVMRAHPNAVPLFTNRPIGAYIAQRAVAERSLQRLEAAGLAARDAALIIRSLVRFVIGFSLTEPQNDAEASTAPAGLRADGYPRLAELIAETTTDDERLFQFNLTALIEGFASRITDGPPVDARSGGDTITA